MRHPLRLDKHGKWTEAPPSNKVSLMIDGYVVGIVEYEDLVPNKTIKLPNNTMLELGSDFHIVDDGHHYLTIQGRLCWGGSI